MPTMRTQLLLILCLGCAPFAGRAWAHRDRIPSLLVVEKVYAADAPLGHIAVRYDGTDEANPKLNLRTELFRSAVPTKMLRALSRPDWERLSLFYSLTSFEPKTGKLVERPYLYLAVPLRGPTGKSAPKVYIELHFRSDGKLSKRTLRAKFSPVRSDGTETIYQDWPLNSAESSDAVLDRALKKSRSR